MRAPHSSNSCCGLSAPRRDNQYFMGFLDRLREGLSRTKQEIVTRFDEIVQRADAETDRSEPIDVDTVEALEELLISADVGVAATERIVGAVRTRAHRGERSEERRVGKEGRSRW